MNENVTYDFEGGKYPPVATIFAFGLKQTRDCVFFCLGSRDPLEWFRISEGAAWVEAVISEFCLSWKLTDSSANIHSIRDLI